jgi:pyrroloquinoline quinone biosynthesis protein D
VANATKTRLMVEATSTLLMPRHIKMRHDAGRGRWIILAPERVFDPDEIAVEVLKLCDGNRSVETIVEQMAKDYSAPESEIRDDIIAMLQDLADKGVVVSSAEN